MKTNRSAANFTELYSHRDLITTTAGLTTETSNKPQNKLNTIHSIAKLRLNQKSLTSRPGLDNSTNAKLDESGMRELKMSDLNSNEVVHRYEENKDWVAKGNKLYTFCGQASSANKCKKNLVEAK